ncbi:MAG: glycosyltransferase [Chloroflexi bacterium]|nr:glycosyltransferase [Chloroflexota bacterium]
MTGESRVKRVLLVSLGYFQAMGPTGGGVDFHVYNIANALARKGMEVHLVADLAPQALVAEGVVVHPIGVPRFPLKGISFVTWVKNYVRANWHAYRRARQVLALARRQHEPYDVVHAHGNLCALLLSLHSDLGTLIYTMHNPTPWICKYEDWQERVMHTLVTRTIEVPLWRRCQGVIALTPEIAHEVARFGVPRDRIHTIGNGVDHDFYRPSSPRHNLDGFDGVTLGRPYCIFVGQLMKRKGVHYLLKALSQTPDLSCLIVGEGPERESLTALAHSLGISDRVVFAGARPPADLPGYYSAADFFVLPSLAEAFPLVLLEAMSCGLPVIATKADGTLAIVRDGYNGLVVEPGDVAGLASRLREMTADNTLRRIMGARARETVVNHWGWDKITNEVLNCYEGACSPDTTRTVAEGQGVSR